MKWLKEYQNHEVCLVGDDELTKGRSSCVQMLYEFDIMSTSLPDVKDPNMKPNYVSELSSLSFDVPSSPDNRRLKGLDVTFKYAISGDDCAWFCKISTTNGVDLMYNPKVFGKPEFGKVGIWLSYWPIGNTLSVGDKVNVSIIVMSGLAVHECGVSLVYADETLENNTRWVEILGGDLSGFQLSTGAYYLCRRDFFELMEVGRLTPGWFRILVGDAIDYTEVHGWRKTGRPKQLNQSFTELKTVRCIIHGPESEEIYKIPEMSKSSFVDKSLEFTSSMLGETKKSATSSKPSDKAIKDEDMFEDIDDQFLELASSSSPPFLVPRKKLRVKEFGVIPSLRSFMSKAFVTDDVGGQIKKIVLGVNLCSEAQREKVMKALSALKGVLKIDFDTNDGRLTVIGSVDTMDVFDLVWNIEGIYMISVEPTKKP
ncbi:hypothetical protein L1887_38022 [Cichorium endivia]|nr:hypothetical protein L1887_38022 [Cichorium endivia]